MSDAGQIVKYLDEGLRIVPQELWNAVKKRQREIESMSVRIRGALKPNGRLPRHLLSGLLVCEQCGASFRRVNGRDTVVQATLMVTRRARMGYASAGSSSSASCSMRSRLRS